MFLYNTFLVLFCRSLALNCHSPPYCFPFLRCLTESHFLSELFMRSAGVDVVSSYVITKLSASFYTNVTHNLYRLTNCALRQDAKWKARGSGLCKSIFILPGLNRRGGYFSFTLRLSFLTADLKRYILSA